MSENADRFVMANANRCTVYPQHIMVNEGRSEQHCGDILPMRVRRNTSRQY